MRTVLKCFYYSLIQDAQLNIIQAGNEVEGVRTGTIHGFFLRTGGTVSCGDAGKYQGYNPPTPGI